MNYEFIVLNIENDSCKIDLKNDVQIVDLNQNLIII